MEEDSLLKSALGHATKIHGHFFKRSQYIMHMRRPFDEQQTHHLETFFWSMQNESHLWDRVKNSVQLLDWMLPDVEPLDCENIDAKTHSFGWHDPHPQLVVWTNAPAGRHYHQTRKFGSGLPSLAPWKKATIVENWNSFDFSKKTNAALPIQTS